MFRVLLVCIGVLFAPLANATSNSLFVFGYSLSDGGNAYALSGAT